MRNDPILQDGFARVEMRLGRTTEVLATGVPDDQGRTVLLQGSAEAVIGSEAF